MLLTVMLEKTLESPLDCKESKSVNPKGDQSWIFIGRTDAEAESAVLWPPDANNWQGSHWIRPWCWERLKVGGEGDFRRWDGWMTLPTQWTWVWACKGNWWWRRNPGMLQPMRLQRIDVTEQLNSTDDKVNSLLGMWGPRKLSQVPENGLYHGTNRKL